MKTVFPEWNYFEYKKAQRLLNKLNKSVLETVTCTKSFSRYVDAICSLNQCKTLKIFIFLF